MTHPHLKFDVAKLERLNDPGRFDSLPPQEMWAAFDIAVESTVIEIGAGTGLFASAFTRIDPALRVFATDIEPVMIEWMREHLPEVLEGRIVPLLAEESRVPLDDEMVDGAYMINLHHELADPDASYREAARLLKPGGRILVVDWLDRETPKGPPMQVRASAVRLREHLLAAGFDDVEVHASLEMHSMLSATKPGDSGV
jgi:ubiquinone/menaquinone biosynthesis C-methylase UbiE